MLDAVMRDGDPEATTTQDLSSTVALSASIYALSLPAYFPPRTNLSDAAHNANSSISTSILRAEAFHRSSGNAFDWSKVLNYSEGAEWPAKLEQTITLGLLQGFAQMITQFTQGVLEIAMHLCSLYSCHPMHIRSIAPSALSAL